MVVDTNLPMCDGNAKNLTENVDLERWYGTSYEILRLMKTNVP